ncbi:MAG: hypothetical protein ABFD44_03530 [Anaerolineaceae bacterium]
MSAKKATAIDPMREGHPEAFSDDRTIPAWDLSDWFAAPGTSPAEVNGAAYEKNNECLGNGYFEA